MSDKMAGYIIRIAAGVAHSPRFRQLPDHVREDLQQQACYKMIAGMKNLDESRRKSFFAYFTQCAISGCFDLMRRHHKQLKIKARELERLSA